MENPIPFLLRVASDCVSVSVLGCSLDGEKAMGKRSGKAGAGEDFTSSLSASESGCEEPREHFLSHLRQFMESRGFVHCPLPCLSLSLSLFACPLLCFSLC